MPYTAVPDVSNRKIIKAGNILISENNTIEEKLWAYELANQWRACHAYPINTFQSLLRKKIREGNYKGHPIVAKRLKRMPIIIDKLKRYPNMNLFTMQDIGGLRAVVSSINEVYELRNTYFNCPFAHELIDEKDYIKYPRSEDGYRSIHLIYKYINKRNPNYDGLRVEFQIRTLLQHLWATAVETMGTFLGQALKSRQGNQDWLDFFALVSSAFSYMEKTPQIPRYLGLSQKETSIEISKINKKLGVVEKMSGLSTAVHLLSNKKGSSYYLIILNSLEKSVEMYSYDRQGLEYALNDYKEYEKKVLYGEKIEPVLVSAGKIDDVRKAYPSFFLDIFQFLQHVENLIKDID